MDSLDITAAYVLFLQLTATRPCRLDGLITLTGRGRCLHPRTAIADPAAA